MLAAQDRTLALKAKLFRGLADPSRLALLEELRDGARTVSELAAATGLTQPNTSNHLACLRDCGLVEREQRGRFVSYRIADPRLVTLLTLADDLLVTHGDNVYRCTRYRGD